MSDTPRIYARDYTDAEIDAMEPGPLLTWLAWQAVEPVTQGDGPAHSDPVSRISESTGAALAAWQRLCEALPFGSFIQLSYDAKHLHQARIWAPDVLTTDRGAGISPMHAIGRTMAKYAARTQREAAASLKDTQ